jgi:hypothetical protein
MPSKNPSGIGWAVFSLVVMVCPLAVDRVARAARIDQAGHTKRTPLLKE